MKKYSKCQVCYKEDARCGLYKTVYILKKIFIYVCYKCEKEIGDENESQKV